MKNITKHKFYSLTIAMALLLPLSSFSLFSQDMNLTVGLRGQWKFMIGDNPEWKNPDFNDSNWENIYVPKPWEEQGFNGYDGYAWYRKTFVIPNISDKNKYYLDLGYIDDVDQTYINGVLVGKTGSFPPNFSTAYRAHRLYPIPIGLLNKTNKLTVAVRVYDDMGAGGITDGSIGIMTDKSPLIPDLDLEGIWKFSPRKCVDPKDTQWDYNSWSDIIVPADWEEQGYKNLDGVACYAKQFKLNGQFENKRMVLLMGRIDDLDMVYVNGILVGQSGDFTPSYVNQHSDEYKQFRGYYLPEDVLNQNGNNIIVVRVLDTGGEGGIWQGPIGLITQDNYIKYWRSKRNSIN